MPDPTPQPAPQAPPPQGDRTVISETVVLGEDGLAMTDQRLWLDVGDGQVGFQLFKTGEQRGEVIRDRTAVLIPAGRKRALVRTAEAASGPVDPTSITADQAQRLSQEAARPKAFLKVAEGKGRLLADVKADAWPLLKDAKAAGLMTKLEGFAETG